MNEWKPIDTAPKDGTRILICREGEDVSMHEVEIVDWYVLKHDVYTLLDDGNYRKTVEIFSEGWNGNGHRATHWMLPPKPYVKHGK